MPVVDASVAIKWFVREPLHDAARRLLDEHTDDLGAVDLIVAEVTNVAWTKARGGEISGAQAREIAHAIGRGAPVLYPVALFNERALELALLLDHPVYDCLYLACAEALETTLVTADKRFCAAARKSGFAARVLSLAP